MEKGYVQIREGSKGVRMTLKVSGRQMDGQWCHKLNKKMDGEGDVSEINSKHVIFYHKLGKFVFKKLVHLDECNHLKLPSAIYTQLESSVTFFFLVGSL